MKGGIAEMRNQSTNELPFSRPTIPPARPKQTAMTTKAPPAISGQGAHGPEDADDRNDHGDDPGDAHDDADDDLQQEPGGDREDEDGQDACAERRTGLLHAVHGTARGRPAGAQS